MDQHNRQLVIYFDHPKLSVEWLAHVLSQLTLVHAAALQAFSLEEFRSTEHQIVRHRRRGQMGLAIDYISTAESLTLRCRSGWFLPRVGVRKGEAFLEVPASAAIVAFIIYGVIWSFKNLQEIRKTDLEIQNLEIENALKKHELEAERLKSANADLLRDSDVLDQLHRQCSSFANGILTSPAPYRVIVNDVTVYDEEWRRQGPGGPGGQGAQPKGKPRGKAARGSGSE